MKECRCGSGPAQYVHNGELICLKCFNLSLDTLDERKKRIAWRDKCNEQLAPSGRKMIEESSTVAMRIRY